MFSHQNPRQLGQGKLKGNVHVGAQTSQNYIKRHVTHVVASEGEASGPVWRAKVSQGLNIIALSWLLQVCVFPPW